jgi:hypothetical protein
MAFPAGLGSDWGIVIFKGSFTVRCWRQLDAGRQHLADARPERRQGLSRNTVNRAFLKPLLD